MIRSMVTQTARTTARPAFAPARATKVRFGGAMGVRKNGHIEQWNNLREDTHKTWTFNASTTPKAVFWLPVFCTAVYSLLKMEQKTMDRKAVEGKGRKNAFQLPPKKLEYL
jgi:hypothetical protein